MGITKLSRESVGWGDLSTAPAAWVTKAAVMHTDIEKTEISLAKLLILWVFYRWLRDCLFLQQSLQLP